MSSQKVDWQAEWKTAAQGKARFYQPEAKLSTAWWSRCGLDPLAAAHDEDAET
jgi:hypothetical protein